MIEIEKTERDKKNLAVKRKKDKKKISEHVNVLQSRFYDELKLAETEDLHIEFENLVQEITQQGERFYKNPTLQDLKLYKSMIRKFLKYVTDRMFAVEQHTGGKWKQKIYTISKVIDTKLEALTKLVVSQQANNINLLSALDEIRGLLIDLYK
ncbi:MAG TPA: YaaR family protein [Spirochaetota bacterium]|nr:YaaR family protein [Spirochaetota bacterium]